MKTHKTIRHINVLSHIAPGLGALGTEKSRPWKFESWLFLLYGESFFYICSQTQVKNQSNLTFQFPCLLACTWGKYHTDADSKCLYCKREKW